MHGCPQRASGHDSPGVHAAHRLVAALSGAEEEAAVTNTLIASKGLELGDQIIRHIDALAAVSLLLLAVLQHQRSLDLVDVARTEVQNLGDAATRLAQALQ